jgi:hypothetical protein
MSKKLRFLGPIILLLAICEARAGSFTPTFSDYPFPGSQYTVDAPANAFFSANYGISISNAYLYKDSRDTFDGIGIANGTAANNYVPDQTGRIDFLDTTNFVSIDFLAILSTTYQVLDGGGNVIDTFTADPGVGTHLFSSSGAAIAALIFTSTGGFGTVSGLTYDYDGTTDGQNTDLNGQVPDGGATMVMVGLSLIGLVGFKRKYSRA